MRVWEMLKTEEGRTRYKSLILNHPSGWSVFGETCYCHDPYFAKRDGSLDPKSEHYKENAPDGRMGQDTADALFIEWVYILDEHEDGLDKLHILTSQPGEGKDADGFPKYVHRHVKTLIIGLDEWPY